MGASSPILPTPNWDNTLEFKTRYLVLFATPKCYVRLCSSPKSVMSPVLVRDGSHHFTKARSKGNDTTQERRSQGSIPSHFSSKDGELRFEVGVCFERLKAQCSLPFSPLDEVLHSPGLRSVCDRPIGHAMHTFIGFTSDSSLTEMSLLKLHQHKPMDLLPLPKSPSCQGSKSQTPGKAVFVPEF